MDHLVFKRGRFAELFFGAPVTSLRSLFLGDPGSPGSGLVRDLCISTAEPDLGGQCENQGMGQCGLLMGQ